MKGKYIPQYRLLLTTVFTMLFTWSIIGQSNPDSKDYTILIGTDLLDTVETLNGTQPKVKNQSDQDYSAQTSPIGGNDYEVIVTFEPDVQGHRTLILEYYVQGQTFVPEPRYMVMEIDIVPSIVNAVDDVFLKTSDTLIILPLANDYSSLGNHQLTSINQTKYGTSSISGDSIIYVGLDEEDVILYSIKDSIGTTDQGVIYITSDDTLYTGIDTVSYFITNKQSKLLLNPNSNYTLTTSPVNGSVESISSLGFMYSPDDGYVGLDEVVFDDGNGNSVSYVINVLDAVDDPGYLKNDREFTPVDEAVVFNVYDNDLLQSGILINYSSELTVVSPGVFSYTPPTGFVGVKDFFYEKDFGILSEIGTIKISVGNFKPTKAYPYIFDVLTDKDFYIDYNVPIDGYSFTIVNNPLHGSAATFTELDTFIGECGDVVTNNVGIHYSPSQGYTGLDEFDVEYCINGGQCDFYKLRFNVTTPIQDSICNCVEDCVWEGDANGDGRVSVTDLLSIGRYMGYGGDTRSTTDQGIWNGETSGAWNVDQINGANTNHIDGDNNGVVTESDVDALLNNYGKTHALVPEEILAIKDYPFYLIPNSTELDSGDLLILQIAIGNQNYPVEDVHGLAFGLNIPPGFIDSASFEMEMYDDTWFTNQSPTIDVDVHKVEGKIDVGYTRTNGLGISGYGIIGQLSFIVEEDAHGIKTSEVLKKISNNVYIQDATMEDSYGKKYALPDAVVTVNVNLDNNTPNPTEDKLVISPNPANGQFVIHFNGGNTIHGVTVYDMTGRLVMQDLNVDHNQYFVSTYDFNEGVHIVKCNTSQGVITKRVSITK